MSNSENAIAKSIKRTEAFFATKDPNAYIDELGKPYKSAGQQYREWLEEENKKGNYL